MLAAERQSLIVKQSRINGVVRTRGLAVELGVAEETIRRDLDKLARSGVVDRIHGGATSREFVAHDFAYAEREIQQQPEKMALARRAVQTIESGETVLLDASSTCLQMARLIPARLALRVVTYSLPVLEILKGNSELELVSLGGSYDSKGRRFGGLLTEQNLMSYGIDRFFFSAKGFDIDKGVSEADEEQARLKTVGVRQASWTGLLVDRSKLGVDSRYYFCRAHELDEVFVDGLGREYFSKVSLRDGKKLTIVD